jgi:hypothetical protein
MQLLLHFIKKEAEDASASKKFIELYFFGLFRFPLQVHWKQLYPSATTNPHVDL